LKVVDEKKKLGRTAISQFHQHFPRYFFDNILVPEKFNPKTQLCHFGRQNIGAKCVQKHADEIDN